MPTTFDDTYKAHRFITILENLEMGLLEPWTYEVEPVWVGLGVRVRVLNSKGENLGYLGDYWVQKDH